jgi:hypothetical protein
VRRLRGFVVSDVKMRREMFCEEGALSEILAGSTNSQSDDSPGGKSILQQRM